MARSCVSQADGVVAMQMPSLVKYFAYMGAALLGLISLVNFLLEPSTGATMVQAAAKPAAPVVQHAPGASRIERWRNEQAALKAAAQAQTAENASTAAKSSPEPVRPTVTQAVAKAPEPAAAQSPAPELQTQAASAQPAATAEDDQAAEAERKAEKVKAAKSAKARKARLARERLRAQQAARESGQFYSSVRQRSASGQQDAYYYGQRAPQYQNPSYAYAPRPSYGPFGW